MESNGASLHQSWANWWISSFNCARVLYPFSWWRGNRPLWYIFGRLAPCHTFESLLLRLREFSRRIAWWSKGEARLSWRHSVQFDRFGTACKEGLWRGELRRKDNATFLARWLLPSIWGYGCCLIGYHLWCKEGDTRPAYSTEWYQQRRYLFSCCSSDLKSVPVPWIESCQSSLHGSALGPLSI